MLVQLSYLAPNGARREVEARLTTDHKASVAQQYVLVRNDSNELLTKKIWEAGEYAIESTDPDTRVLAECAIMTP